MESINERCSHRRQAPERFAIALSARLIALFLIIVALPSASAQRAPAAKPFERFDGCLMAPDKWTDGDSFRVRLPDGRFETFRLYFVDTTESRSHSTRSVEQAAYFSITKEAAVALGEVAKVFTARALEKPFTVQTRWRPVFDRTRHYAIVSTAEGDDLASLLVRNGLARIYGTRTVLPDGEDSRSYLGELSSLEAQAKRGGLGGWSR